MSYLFFIILCHPRLQSQCILYYLKLFRQVAVYLHPYLGMILNENSVLFQMALKILSCGDANAISAFNRLINQSYGRMTFDQFFFILIPNLLFHQ